MLIPNPWIQAGLFRGQLSSWKNADSPTSHKYVPLLASKTFIFIVLSLALCKIMSREDEEEGGNNDTEYILQKSCFFYSAVLITTDNFYL